MAVLVGRRRPLRLREKFASLCLLPADLVAGKNSASNRLDESFLEYGKILEELIFAMGAHLNHIGIAVAQLPELKKLFGVLGLQTTHTEAVPDQGVVTHFLPLPREQTSLELLEVSDPEGTVAKFIQKRGPGIHHLSFQLPKGELNDLCSRLKSEGYKLIYDAPRAGAHGMRVNFIHPQSAGGMLIEVME